MLNWHKGIKFTASQTLPANDYSEERTLTNNYLILFDETEGYMLVISGEAEMTVFEKIAENLEIRLTDKTVAYTDFENHNVFIDGGVG